MQAILFKNEESALLFANDKALLGFKTFKYDDLSKKCKNSVLEFIS
jgi:hypothetical protein